MWMCKQLELQVEKTSKSKACRAKCRDKGRGVYHAGRPTKHPPSARQARSWEWIEVTRHDLTTNTARDTAPPTGQHTQHLQALTEQPHTTAPLLNRYEAHTHPDSAHVLSQRMTSSGCCVLPPAQAGSQLGTQTLQL
jgi:hypothetical protein